MKPEYLLVIFILGVILTGVDFALENNTSKDPMDPERVQKTEDSVRPLRTIGIVIMLAAGIPFAVWRAVFFFKATGRHGY